MKIKKPKSGTPHAFKGKSVTGGNKGAEVSHARCQANKRRFLEAFKVLGVITKASKVAKVNPFAHYTWLREDPDYVRQFEMAKEEATDALELEARRRAVDGVARVRFHAGKPIKIKDPKTGKLVVYVEHEYSDRLLEALLRAHRPQLFGQKAEVEVNVPAIDKAIESELENLAKRRQA